MKSPAVTTLFPAVPGTTLLVRGDGRVERVCKHGVGHCIGVMPWVRWQPWMSVHGCDGCCEQFPDRVPL
jgi:hypothetical protein